MKVYRNTAIALMLYLLVAWLIGPVIGLQGRDLWILGSVLSLLGFIGAGMFVWFHRRLQKSSLGDAPNRDLDVLLRQAEERLTSSQLGRNAKFHKLPVVLLLGEASSAKTTVLTQSGLEPELLGGQVYRADSISPTELVNCWFSRGAIFLEASGRLLPDSASWARLVRRLKPAKLAALSRKGAPRAAIVCVSVEDLLQAEASKVLEGMARKLRARLEEVSHALGIKLPVYVLFTKADKIPFFQEYVRNLSNAEASSVLGGTLPLQYGEGPSVWAERETHRLDAAFKNLVYSLSDRRTDFLAREHDSGKLGYVYEFPRELGKLKPAIVKFLVDLCRPSQLRLAPFLRGFYFCGVRPIVLDERVETPAPPATEASTDFGGATRIFRSGERPIGRQQAAAQSIGRKVPQWTFVAHFFNDVLLKDRVALAASASSTKTNTFLRVLLASAALLLLLVACGMTVSYFGNRSLATEVLASSEDLGQARVADPNAPSLEDLARLDRLRASLERLTLFEREGPPLRLRWGLYSGGVLYEEGRKAYYNAFEPLLFGMTQAQLLEGLRRLPAMPGPGDAYGPTYDLLKAYLITTSNHESSTKEFLSPALMAQWSGGRTVEPDRAALVQKQFDFYGDDLKNANPFSSDIDPQAVGRARQYLSQFGGLERIYQAMLAEAAKKSSPINFNQRFPDSAGVLIVDRELNGAFSKDGWAFMQDAVKNVDRFFTGERWVLGEQTTAGIDRQKSELELRARYTADFINQWRTFVKGASVARYANMADGGRKLNRLSSNQSPLLALFSIVSENTAVDSPEVKAAFQSVQFMVPPGNPQQYIGPNNSAYMKALLQLQGALEKAGNVPAGTNSEAATTEVSNNANAAKLVTRELALSFSVDREAHLEAVTQKLMEDPITNAELLVRDIVPGELNAKGRALCAPLQDLMTKFPFNATSTRQATIQEMNAVFHPQLGALWTFYNANLSKYLVKQGSVYVENPTGGVRISPVFISFWNRAASFTEAVYPPNSPQPRLPFSLKPYPTPRGIDRVTLAIEGRTLSASGARPSAQQFIWTGNSNQQLKLTVRVGGGSELAFPVYEGSWAVFQFFADADTWTPSGSVYALEWVFRQGRQGRPVTLPGGSPLTVKFDLDMGQNAPIFQKGYLAGLRCIPEIARS